MALFQSKEERHGVLKGIACLLCVLMLFVLCYVAYYEVHFATHTMKGTEISLEQVNQEAPELVITDSDWKLVDALWKLPEVRELKETVSVEDYPELLDAVSPVLGEKIAKSVSVSAWECEDVDRLIVSWEQEDGRKVSLDGDTTHMYGMNKLVSDYDSHAKLIRTYQNINGEEFMRSKRCRMWMYYLREFVWGNGDVSSPGAE